VVYGGVRWCTGEGWGRAGTYNCNPPAAAVACEVCGFVTLELVFCRKKHAMCFGDFNKHVAVVMKGRRAFIDNGCKISCPYCPFPPSEDTGFERRCAALLDTDTYNLYEKCITEIAVIQAQKECEQRLLASSASQGQTIDPVEAEVLTAVKHITDQLVQPRCPNVNCKVQLTDFEACAGLKCEQGCGLSICGWCLTLQESPALCHIHVPQCPFNPAPGTLYPPSPHPATWWSIMYEWARKRIKDYISSLPQPIQQSVHNVCRTMHPHLAMQPFGWQTSDGYRRRTDDHAQRCGGFEENVTELMVMGLADRARAQQVLEVTGNDLENAANFLLAYNHPPQQ